jgi:hypothetical protein
MTITVTAEEAASITAALDACAPTPNRRAEGLVAMADECLRGSAPNRNPTEVIVHIEADDLSGTTGDGASVPAGTSRRLLCDAGVVAMVRGADGKTLDVGRKTRTIPTAIRRALAHRDKGCQFPGCTHAIVDGHHVEHWADGGETKLANLVSLCRTHHRFVHEGGGSVDQTESGFVFRNATGAVLASVPAPIDVGALPAPEPADVHVAIAKDNARPLDWDSIRYALDI